MSAQVVGSRQHRVTRVLILLPPSEGKTPPRRGKPLDLGSLSFPGLAPHRSEVLDALVGLCSTDRPAEAAQVLGLGRTQEDVVASNARLRQASTGRADQVYSGVLYEALDVAGLQGASRRRATSWLAVTSGLFGMLRPADRIPAYRLSGDVSLPGHRHRVDVLEPAPRPSRSPGGRAGPRRGPALLDVRGVLAT
jgi:cytoplasmic iron level regulating protein YaaA (DUF328/UPF0246 family)